jgi:hypothetical protein
MAYIKSNEIEQIVKTIMAANYPQLASQGMINVPVPNPSIPGVSITDRESIGVNSRRQFVCGSSRIGGGRVVGV